ncbi:aldehyde dehydrogenase family protein [Nonomuraea typhae]|uniref:Aldehyde dehydrogenase family protein n=1 Tax=Nonomuraea typhae TaxID=2603600 RepID=A0ABW7Z708_9ACTN
MMETLRFYGEPARTFGFEQRLADEDGSTLITMEPAGVVAAVVPWNAPLLIAAAKIAPAIVAGCAVVLKPARRRRSARTCCTRRACPRRTQRRPGRQASEHLIAHPGVDKVSFTGSSATGHGVMTVAADRIKRVTLELGGKSAAIVLDDADVDAIWVGPLVAERQRERVEGYVRLGQNAAKGACSTAETVYSPNQPYAHAPYGASVEGRR